MKTGFLHIVFLIGMTILLSLSSCTKKCQVNGCRVRMEHRHSGDKFKSKIRPWYAFQNPRVGRDYKRDKSPDKIPWDGPDIEGGAESNMMVSNDTSSFGDDGFMGDDFYEDDSLGAVDEFAPLEEEVEDTGKKKKRKRRGEEDEEVKEEPAGDPWDIENIKEEDPVVRKPIVEEKKLENAQEEEKDSEENKEDKDEDKKAKKKSKKELAKEREERLKKELQEEEEEDDDWGF